jgi:hypothetical protein
VNGKDEHSGLEKQIKDIDLGFGCSGREMANLCGINKWLPASMRYTGLIQIGNVKGDMYLEGKSINSCNNDVVTIVNNAPPSIGTDLARENICRDFACNSLWYDPINHTIIDATGYGIKDAIAKIIRIPVQRNYYNLWSDGKSPCDT